VIDIMAALARRDVALLRDGIERVADVGGTVSPERLERAIAGLMTEGLRPGAVAPPALLADLVPLLAELGIHLPGDLVLLSRALVTLDGTLAVLSPGLSVVAAALELAGPAADEPIVDPEELVRDELLAALARARRLPDRLDRIMTLAARGDMRLRTVVDEDGSRVLRTLVNRALLAGIGAAFLVAAAVLLAAPDGGPGVAGETSLFHVLGFGGLFVGSVLLFRVVAAVARDGTT
jgi:ubiquinone biosynthesis protein